MRRIVLAAIAAAAALAPVPGSAQQPADGTQVKITTEPALLGPDEQKIVRDYVAREKIPPATLAAPLSPGMAVPDTVALWGLPKDMLHAVPKVIGYRYIVNDGKIAVIDPGTHKVIQMIEKEK